MARARAALRRAEPAGVSGQGLLQRACEKNADGKGDTAGRQSPATVTTKQKSKDVTHSTGPSTGNTTGTTGTASVHSTGPSTGNTDWHHRHRQRAQLPGRARGNT